MVAAEEFVLIPKHVYVREQPHAAHVLLDNSIEHKKPQLSYLNRMRPQLPLKQSDASTDTKPGDGTYREMEQMLVGMSPLMLWMLLKNV